MARKLVYVRTESTEWRKNMNKVDLYRVRIERNDEMESKVDKSNDAKSLIGALGGCASVLVMTIITMALAGYVTTHLWNGLIADTFNLPTLSYWQGLGLDWFVSYITGTLKPKDDGYTSVERFGAVIIVTLAFWFFGDIIMIFI